MNRYASILIIFLCLNTISNPIFASADYITFNSEIDGLISQLMLEGNIPSLATCVINKDQIIWSKGYGDQINENLSFIIASITKTFTATALLQLNEQGLIDLDEDVNNFLPFSVRNPNFPDSPITFRMLLSHQSSLLRGGAFYQSFVFNDLDLQLGQTNETLPNFPEWLDDVILAPDVENISEVWSAFTPGEKQNNLAYSNLGYDLLAYLIELISKQTIGEYFQSNIFDPLNMTKTHYTHQSYLSEELALPYEWIPEEVNIFNFSTDENDLFHLSHFNLDEMGAGALRSTTNDLGNFLIAHMNNGKFNDKRILSERSINLMHNTSQEFYGNKKYDSYGFAWFNNKINSFEINEDRYNQPLQGHSGRTYGFNSLMFFNQETQVGVILLVNQGFLFVPEFDNLWEIYDILYEEGFRYSLKSSTESSSGFSFLLELIAIGLSVFFFKFRNNKISKKTKRH